MHRERTEKTKGIKADVAKWESRILHIILANFSVNLKLHLQNFFLKTKEHVDWKNKREVFGQKAREPRREAGMAASTCFRNIMDSTGSGPPSPPLSLLGSQQGQGNSMGKGHLSLWLTAPGKGLEPRRDRKGRQHPGG